MKLNFFNKFFKASSTNQSLTPFIQDIIAINNLENSTKLLSNHQLKSRILYLKDYIKSNHDNKEALDNHLHEVYSIVREASYRALNLRHFDMQILGGIALHQGNIIEMGTGEGKTLTATLPAVLNALSGNSVHIVTVNDYLASRDADWMGRIYQFLGLSVGVISSLSNTSQRKQAYLSDIVHGQNNEFAFDYLRDNTQLKVDGYVQQMHNYVIIDEVDSVLIDECRNPLIISGHKDESLEKYICANKIAPRLVKNLDFSIDEHNKSISLTERGMKNVEKLLKIQNLYDPSNIELLHSLTQALRAHILFKRYVDYLIEQGEVIIIDEHTGRLMAGRRWSDGLHQAIEAKENVKIQNESPTLASITFPNYFKLYKKLSGMSGTAATETEEFLKIYNTHVLTIPTSSKRIRYDEHDKIYKTEHEKIDAILQDIMTSHQNNQPILIGTTSVEKSEILSNRLRNLDIKHNVLNAKNHKNEAEIIAQAGRLNAVTIATNMAGRGTDIVLGGDSEFLARTEVAKKMSHSSSQIAEFAFLTGKPETIIPDEKNKKFQTLAISYYSQYLPYFINQCINERKKVILTGGLRVIGTERHESRRIDNQLRGRSGRQGDPGSSRFYISLEDNLMKILGVEKLVSTMNSFGFKHGESIEHQWANKSIENAQKTIEGNHFDARKDLIDYDDIINLQRQLTYALRKKILFTKDSRELILDLIESFILLLIPKNSKRKNLNKEHLEYMCSQIYRATNILIDVNDVPNTITQSINFFYHKISLQYKEKEKEFDNTSILRSLEQQIYLTLLDKTWRDHLQSMNTLKEGIQFIGYAQKDPKQEYLQESSLAYKKNRLNLCILLLEVLFKGKLYKTPINYEFTYTL